MTFSRTRECLALEVAGSLSSRDVAQVPSRVASTRRLPTTIACYNGAEFTSRALEPSGPTRIACSWTSAASQSPPTTPQLSRSTPASGDDSDGKVTEALISDVSPPLLAPAHAANQYTDDGIVELFGTPIAREDHAQRA